jgi:hypothetical protein
MNGIGVSAVNAYTAHREWASRPPDERYASVHALYEAARARRIRTEERTIETVAVRTEAVGADALALRDASGRQPDPERAPIIAKLFEWVRVGRVLR